MGVHTGEAEIIQRTKRGVTSFVNHNSCSGSVELGWNARLRRRRCSSALLLPYAARHSEDVPELLYNHSLHFSHNLRELLVILIHPHPGIRLRRAGHVVVEEVLPRALTRTVDEFGETSLGSGEFGAESRRGG